MSLALPYMVRERGANGKMGVSSGSMRNPDKCSAVRAGDDIRQSFVVAGAHW